MSEFAMVFDKVVTIRTKASDLEVAIRACKCKFRLQYGLLEVPSWLGYEIFKVEGR